MLCHILIATDALRQNAAAVICQQIFKEILSLFLVQTIPPLTGVQQPILGLNNVNGLATVMVLGHRQNLVLLDVGVIPPAQLHVFQQMPEILTPILVCPA
jgi:hypothetical protein